MLKVRGGVVEEMGDGAGNVKVPTGDMKSAYRGDRISLQGPWLIPTGDIGNSSVRHLAPALLNEKSRECGVRERIRA